MKITAFNGSPRGESGNTHVMVEEFLQGAAGAGAETENILLAKKRIGHCLGCLKCWLATPGECVIKDDMSGLLEKFASSDVVVFATPLYVDNVTGIMKNFMDRLIPMGDPHFDKDEGGECRHRTVRGKAPAFAVISNCGFPEQSHFQVLKLLFARVARNFSTNVVVEIYRGGGAILKDTPLLAQPLVYNYKRLLRKAGSELVKDMKMSGETIAALDRPIVPENMYIKSANEYFDSVLNKLKKDS